VYVKIIETTVINVKLLYAAVSQVLSNSSYQKGYFVTEDHIDSDKEDALNINRQRK
jgi:hypothetical protein